MRWAVLFLAVNANLLAVAAVYRLYMPLPDQAVASIDKSGKRLDDGHAFIVRNQEIIVRNQEIIVRNQYKLAERMARCRGKIF